MDGILQSQNGCVQSSDSTHCMNKLYHIIDGIYLSNLYSAHDLNLINENKIKLVIRLSEYDDNLTPYDKSIQFINIDLEDWQDDKDKLIPTCDYIYKIINSFDGNILIHCNEGRSRSVSVIIYYLMKQYKYTYDHAYQYIYNIKSDLRINSAFVAELKKNEK
jgi:protein-tyrosine phosphatase